MKGLYDYKVGEIAEMSGIAKDFLGEKAKLVKIGYTFQSVDGKEIQMEVAIKHEDYAEDEETEKTAQEIKV